jgi:ribosomal protein L7Ae-like RNA K-turn-binding protein
MLSTDDERHTEHEHEDDSEEHETTSVEHEETKYQNEIHEEVHDVLHQSSADETEEEPEDEEEEGDHESVGAEVDEREEDDHQKDSRKSVAFEVEHVDMTGTIDFDPTFASPVYFGASFKRRLNASDAMVEEGQGDAATKSKGKLVKTRALPLTRPVRDYVNQALSKDLDELVVSMISTLFKYQERARAEDPIKAKLRRRLVMGLHEVRRGVRSRKCIAVIVAPNIEDIAKLDESVDEILTLCTTPPVGLANDMIWEPIPVIFAANKKSLAKAVGKRTSVSCIGVYSADGAHEQYKQCLSLSAKLMEFWKIQVEVESKLALNGKRPSCGGCSKPVFDLARRDCLNCRESFCESCAASRQAKKVHCPAAGASLISSSPTAGDVASCAIVRVARTLPPLVPKVLSVSAPEFVPPRMSVAAPIYMPPPTVVYSMTMPIHQAPALTQPPLIRVFTPNYAAPEYVPQQQHTTM